MAGEAYGQTDVMHDPNYLQALARSANPRDRAVAEHALQQMQMEQTRQQQLMEFGMRQDALAQEHAARGQDRADALAARREATGEAEKGRTARAAEMMQFREGAEKDRVTQGLLQAADRTMDPAERKMIMNEYYTRLGVQMPTGAAAGGVHPAIQRVVDRQGGQQPATTTPARGQPTAPQAPQPTVAETMTNAQVNPPTNLLTSHPTGSRTAQLPSGGTATYFDRTTPEGREAIGRPHDIPQFRELTASGAPMNVSVPLNRSSIMPSGVMSERREIPAPFSPANLATNPPPNEAMQPTPIKPGLPTLGGEQAPPTAATPFAPGTLTAQPQPNPTPSGPQPLGPFSGSIGNITQGPLPTPSGTPPAQPAVLPKPPVLSEEEKRRQLATVQ